MAENGVTLFRRNFGMYNLHIVAAQKTNIDNN
jgi:hypothetical protein